MGKLIVGMVIGLSLSAMTTLAVDQNWSQREMERMQQQQERWDQQQYRQQQQQRAQQNPC